MSSVLAGVRQPWRFAWRGLIQPCLGWIVFGWLTALVPKKPGRVVVIGLRRQFADNSKYFFLQLLDARPPGIEVRYLGDDRGVAAMLRSAGLPVVSYPSLRGLWYLLRCETVVADASSWVRPLRHQVLWRARKVQLWHGCPLKRIELDDERGRGSSWLLALSQRLIGRYPRYDIVLSPSARFTAVAFRQAFGLSHIVEGDYPRNVVFRRRDSRFLLGTEPAAAAWIDEGRRRGLTTVCYLPTFRDTGGDAMSDGALDPERLERFAASQGFQFLIKQHPVAGGRAAVPAGPRVWWYDAGADVYPLLPDCDVLVTDYSSVFFDFLHADRPIVFFAYDLEKYQARDRSLYFEYESLVPGPVCRTQDDLERVLLECRRAGHVDAYAVKRAAVRAWAFAPADLDLTIVSGIAPTELATKGRAATRRRGRLQAAHAGPAAPRTRASRARAG